jgi:hypothetical protein
MPKIGNRGVDLEAGESFVLAASAARGATAGTNGTGVFLGGERQRYIVYLNVTAGTTDATDTLDVYVDWSLDDVTYFNGGHFTQVLGNAAVKAFFMVFDPSAPTATDLDITADAAVHTSRPALFGPYVRTRYIIVDAGGGVASFTFSVKGYAI